MTKIEVIAREIVKVWSRIGGDVYDLRYPADLSRLAAADLSSVKVDGNVDFLLLVRAVVKAMRDPTDAMVKAAYEVDGSSDIPEECWRLMIDALLAETEAPT